MSPTISSPGTSTKAPSERRQPRSARAWGNHLTKQQPQPAQPSSQEPALTPSQMALMAPWVEDGKKLTQDQALARLKQNQRARRRGNPETPIVKGCLDLLILMGIYAWRNNTGVLKDRTGRPVKYGKVGSSDILGILRGRFLAIEVKVPGEQPTPEQWEFLRRVEADGGLALVVHSAAEMKYRIDGILDAFAPSGSIAARARQFVARMPRFVAIIDREAHQAVQQLFEEALTR